MLDWLKQRGSELYGWLKETAQKFVKVKGSDVSEALKLAQSNLTALQGYRQRAIKLGEKGADAKRLIDAQIVEVERAIEALSKDVEKTQEESLGVLPLIPIIAIAAAAGTLIVGSQALRDCIESSNRTEVAKKAIEAAEKGTDLTKVPGLENYLTPDSGIAPWKIGVGIAATLGAGIGGWALYKRLRG